MSEIPCSINGFDCRKGFYDREQKIKMLECELIILEYRLAVEREQTMLLLKELEPLRERYLENYSKSATR